MGIRRFLRKNSTSGKSQVFHLSHPNVNGIANVNNFPSCRALSRQCTNEPMSLRMFVPNVATKDADALPVAWLRGGDHRLQFEKT